MTTTTNALPGHGSLSYRGHNLTIPVTVFVGFLISLLVYKVTANTFSFPQFVIDAFPFEDKVNEAQKWLEL